jgi:hypothetical protein
MAISVYVTTGVVARPRMTWPAEMVRDCFAPVFAHSGHWNPTDAVTMQLGQMGRLHRWQVTPARRSPWR